MTSRERSPAESAQLKLRLREPLRASLEAAAKARGVSLNAEAADRLARSFDQQNIVDALFGGPDVAGIAMIIARVLSKTESLIRILQKRTDDPALWRDPYAFDQAVEAVNAVLEALRPSGDATPPHFSKDPLNDLLMTQLGEGFALSTLRAVFDADYGSEEEKAWAREVRARLGGAPAREAKR
jgi:hypothetical protein